MPLLNSFFLNVKEGTAVKAAVPLLGATETERFHCFFKKAEPPKFTLSFPHGALSVDQVDTSKSCMVMIDFSDQTVTISADVTQVVDPVTLELVALETVTHTQTRNYFRVDATTRVAATSLVPKEMDKGGESWRVLGDTIDLSGSGLLCSFSEPLEKGQQVRIELVLPTSNMDTIKAFGHVVRCRKIEETLYHVALHFDLIDSESQDKIMACCFELQRRYLRMRVQLENQS